MRLQRFQESIVPLAAATTLNGQGIAPTLLAEAFLAIEDPNRAWEYVQIALTRQPHFKRAQHLAPIIRDASELRMREIVGEDPGIDDK